MMQMPPQVLRPGRRASLRVKLTPVLTTCNVSVRNHNYAEPKVVQVPGSSANTLRGGAVPTTIQHSPSHHHHSVGSTI